MKYGGPVVGNFPQYDQLKGVPVMRGWDGGSGQSWETVGNGRKLFVLKLWLKKGDFPADWKDKLGDNFVDEMTKKKWGRYACPQCDKLI
jgi:hypothetical protein